jgi:hypothetical protein
VSSLRPPEEVVTMPYHEATCACAGCATVARAGIDREVLARLVRRVLAAQEGTAWRSHPVLPGVAALLGGGVAPREDALE